MLRLNACVCESPGDPSLGLCALFFGAIYLLTCVSMSAAPGSSKQQIGKSVMVSTRVDNSYAKDTLARLGNPLEDILAGAKTSVKDRCVVFVHM